jgi:hypothetical protein
LSELSDAGDDSTTPLVKTIAVTAVDLVSKTNLKIKKLDEIRNEPDSNESVALHYMKEGFMKGKVTILAMALMITVGFTQTTDTVTPSQITQKIPAIEELAADQVIIDAVKKQNAKEIKIQQIQAVEMGWVLDEDDNPRMRALLHCACADRLREASSADSSYRELMVMDNQGALVCCSAKTSDYWQGDEAKWQNAFAEGRGDIFVDKMKFDESTGVILIQVSVPIRDGDQVVGVLTVGIER